MPPVPTFPPLSVGSLSLRSIRLAGVACAGLARRRVDLSTPYVYIAQLLTRDQFMVESNYRWASLMAINCIY